MARGGRRHEIAPQSRSAARRSIRRHRRRRACLLQLSLSKFSDLQKRRNEDLRIRVLLKNTYYLLKESVPFPSRPQGESLPHPVLPNSMALFSPAGEELRQNCGMGPDPNGTSPTCQAAGELPNSASQALAMNPEEASVWDALSQEELPRSPLIGSFEMQAATNLQNQPLDVIFFDIDISEFDSIPAPVATSGQPNPVSISQEMEEDLQPKALQLTSQMESDLVDLEHFKELLLNLE